MWRRSSLLTGVLVVLVMAAPTGALALKKPTKTQVQPHSFGSCTALVGYAQSHLASTHGLPEPPLETLSTTSIGAGTTSTNRSATPSLSSAGATSADGGGSGSTGVSTTNNQEAGVDEPDIVKTDGSTIYAIAQGKLQAVSITGGSPKVVGTLDLGNSLTGAQLLMNGNRLIVISSPQYAYPGPVPLAAGASAALRASPYFLYGSQTVLSEVDISDPSAMKVTQTMTVDGRFVDARQVGSSARIVISSAPHAIEEPQLAGGAQGWVPMWRFHDTRTGRSFTRQVASCGTIRRPVQFSGLGMLSIVTVNFNAGLQAAQSTSLMADAQIVYGSQTSLYIATQQWENPLLQVGQLPSGQTTVIDKFDVTDPNVTTFVSAGEVPGYLLNQFSLSEYNGYLRVASTSRPIWWGVAQETPSQGGVPPAGLSQSYVTVLASQGGLLVPVGQVSGLGQGEQIYSVRFVGDAGYVVTYRQVDPLYTIDLSTPSAPRVAGQLELEGYSAYLQPVGAGLLLGIGQDVSTDTNEPTGAQLELFDVSDPSAPRLIAKTSLGTGSSSQVTYDHHAFLFWPATNLAVLPVQVYATASTVYVPGAPPVTSSQPFNGAIGYTVTSSGITEVAPIVQDTVNGSTPTIERSIVIGDQLYTVSDLGVMASRLNSLARQAFVAFPTA
ncbi:MAG TPA: beta-propeller domain-containing protein [Gaiellaceae bacterium]|nr:beta-propeller domain-containing protein [Gaiellaceae bacterium]